MDVEASTNSIEEDTTSTRATALIKKVAEKEGGKQEVVQQWLKQLRGLYKLGKEVAASGVGETERERQFHVLMSAVVQLARPYAQHKGHPLRSTSMLLL